MQRKNLLGTVSVCVCGGGGSDWAAPRFGTGSGIQPVSDTRASVHASGCCLAPAGCAVLPRGDTLRRVAVARCKPPRQPPARTVGPVSSYWPCWRTRTVPWASAVPAECAPAIRPASSLAAAIPAVQGTTVAGGVGPTEQVSAAMSGTLARPESITLSRTAPAAPRVFLVRPASIPIPTRVPAAKLAHPGRSQRHQANIHAAHVEPAITLEQDTQTATIVQPAGTRARVDGQVALHVRAGSIQARRDPLAATVVAAGATALQEHQAVALVRRANTPPVPLRRGARTAHQVNTSRARAKLRA